MKFINRAVSAVAFTVALFATTSTSSPTPFQATTLAYRGQVDGILGYQALQNSARSGRVAGEDILEAAGLEAHAHDAGIVEDFLRNGNDN